MKQFMTTIIIVACLMMGPSFGDDLEDAQAALAAENYQQATTVFAKSFEAGNAEGGYNLARMLELGLGVDRDKAAAIRIYQRTAKDGHIASLNRVALMHYRGEEGIAQDFEQALGYFNQAAEAGDKNALFNLGKMYFEGQGTKKNLNRALKYYRQAADKDHILAMNTLAGLYKNGSHGNDDLEKAREYYGRAALFGNAVGLFETGLFILGDGNIAENQRKAHMHFNLASVRGHPKAAGALQELTDIMVLEDIVAAQAAARDFVAKTPSGE